MDDINVIDLQYFFIYYAAYALKVFKLADRMRSMRTKGASKNRDSSRCRSKLFSIQIIFGTYGMYTCGM